MVDDFEGVLVVVLLDKPYTFIAGGEGVVTGSIGEEKVSGSRGRT